MVGIEWLILVGALALAAGWGVASLTGSRSGKGQARIRELESELQNARQELEDYRGEVTAQFTETARKFRTLNDSYADLHRQLAQSASVLCGSVAGPLLEAPPVPEARSITAADEKKTTEAATGSTDPTQPPGSSEQAPTPDPDIVVPEPEPALASNPEVAEPAREEAKEAEAGQKAAANA